MKTVNAMKKFVNITTIFLVVLLLVQIGLMFMPFFEDRIPKPRLSNNFDPQPTDYSMMDYAFFQTEELNYIFKTEFKTTFSDKKYSANNYVMGIVLAFALGAVALVSNIVSRRSIFTHLISVLWAVYAIPAFINDKIMTVGAQPIRIACIVVSCLGGLIVLAQLYPWFASRFLKNKFVKKEAAAAEAAA